MSIQINKMKYRRSVIDISKIRNKQSDYFTTKQRTEAYINAINNSFIEHKISTTPFNIDSLQVQYLNSKYPENVCADPISDLKEYKLWNTGIKKFPYNNPYKPLNITGKEYKVPASISAMESIGCIVMGAFIEWCEPQKPIARNVLKSPDLISFNIKSNKFYFNEAKANKNKFAPKHDLFNKSINHLKGEVCNVCRIYRSNVTNLDPIEIELDIIDIEKAGKVSLDYEIILESLYPEIEIIVLTKQHNFDDALKKILGESNYAKVKKKNNEKIEELKIKINTAERNLLNEDNQLSEEEIKELQVPPHQDFDNKNWNGWN